MVTGRVMTQAVTIFCAVPHLTPENLLDEPTPIIAEEITWVVLTGIFSRVATRITQAEVRSEAKPLAGSNFIILVPTVFIIFQPPAEVPRAMATAADSFTQKGISMLS